MEELFFAGPHFHFGDSFVTGELPPKGTIISQDTGRGRKLGSLEYQIEGNEICVTRSSLAQSGFVDFRPTNLIVLPRSINGLPVRKYKGKVDSGNIFIEGGQLTELELTVLSGGQTKPEYSENEQIFEYRNACICSVSGFVKTVLKTTVHCNGHLLFAVPGEEVRIDAPYATPVMNDDAAKYKNTIAFYFSGEVLPYLRYYPFEGCADEDTSFFSGRETLKNVAGILRGKQSWSFCGCKELKGIHYGNGMKKILPGCFKGCSSLTDLFVPNSVCEIGRSAFEGCSSLKSVHLPPILYAIDDRAFFGCTDLIKVFVPDTVKRIGVENVRFSDVKDSVQLLFLQALKE